MNDISVRYIWFSQDFNQNDNFFSAIINSAGLTATPIRDLKVHADLEIVSVFPPKIRKLAGAIKSIGRNYPYGLLDYELKALTFKYPKRGNCTKRIWYSGENIRPPLVEDFDNFFSFDQDSFGGKNYYLPLYFQEIGLAEFQNNIRVQSVVKQNDLTLERQVAARSKFACSFFSNPHPIRLAALRELKSIGEVGIFGRALGNPVRFKEEVAKDYKFVVCFENDLYPGYITEKLVDAYKCGAIPLYWGDLGNDTNINRESFINLRDFKSLSALVEYLKAMSETEYSEIQKLPFLKKVPDISDIKSVILNI